MTTLTYSNEQAICGFEKVLSTVVRMTSHLVVGASLCKLLISSQNAQTNKPAEDQQYLEAVVSYMRCMILTTGILRMVPRFLLPVLGPLVTIPHRINLWRCESILRPAVEIGLYNFSHKGVNPGLHHLSSNDDFLSWTIRDLSKHEHLKATYAHYIAARMMFITHTSTLATSLAAHTALVTLAKCSEVDIERIRDEIEGSLDNHKPDIITENYNGGPLDSFLRETLRIQVMTTLGMGRKVIAKNGITLPDGAHVPQGLHLCIPTYLLHHDQGPVSDGQQSQFSPFYNLVGTP